VDAVESAYFETTIRPLIDNPLVDFLGEVDDARKGALLRGALALLFPIDWPEPFGLILIEALACGTPIIAHRCGSVPEIVRDGLTGFVCETDEELAHAAHRIHRVDRRACRVDFESRFTATMMAKRYVELYEMLAEPREARPRDGACADRGVSEILEHRTWARDAT